MVNVLAIILAVAPAVIDARTVLCKGQTNCKSESFTGDDIVECSGTCDTTEFFDNVQVTVRDICYEGQFYDNTEARCETLNSCFHLHLHHNAVVTCVADKACLAASAYASSRLMCAGNGTCEDGTFYDSSFVECSGRKSCLTSQGALLETVCPAGQYGFPTGKTFGEGQGCRKCPLSRGGYTPYPGRGNEFERCGCPAGQVVIDGQCVVSEVKKKCTTNSCNFKTITNQIIECVNNQCQGTKFAGSSLATCGEYQSCTGATFVNGSGIGGICSGQYSCALLQVHDIAEIICTGIKSCDTASFHDHANVSCEGFGSCSDAVFYGDSVVECPSTNACLRGDKQGHVPTVCQEHYYGFPDLKGLGCAPCPSGMPGRAFPGRGGVSERCH